MRPDQIRRLLVFGVCALGVLALYVVPGLSAPSQPVAERTTPTRPVPDATAEPVSVASPSATASAARPTAHIQNARHDAATAESVGDDAGGDPSVPAREAHRSRTSRPGGVDHDRVRPAPVTTFRVADMTPETVTIRWAPAHDNVAVVTYQVWLNGFEVASTNELSATVDWFNDDMGQHVVQIRALDAAGNESDSSRSLLVTRPSRPAETTTPTTGARPESQPSESDPSGEHR